MGNTTGILQIGFNDTDSNNDKSFKFNEELPLFEAGQTIRGHVNVDFRELEKMFPGQQGLEFRIKVALAGKERSKIVTGPAARKAERTLMLEQKTLYHVTASEVFTPQWHEFEFELEIPPQMPGSLRCEEGRKSYAELEYRVSAYLEGPKRSRRSLLGGTTVGRKIAIRAAPVPIIVVPFMMQPRSHEIKTFGFKKNGHILFGAFVLDTHVGPDENLEICVACRNYSTADIEDVYFRLIETISWKVDDTNQVRSVERILVDQIAPLPIPAPKDLWYKNVIEDEIGHEEDGFLALYHELKAKKMKYTVQVPSSQEISDDYAGPLVRCTHHLEIRIKTENHVDDPRVRIPLQLKQYTSFEETPNRFMSTAFSVLPQVEDAVSVHHATYISEHSTRDPLRNQIEGILEENTGRTSAASAAESRNSNVSADGHANEVESEGRYSNISFNSQTYDDLYVRPPGESSRGAPEIIADGSADFDGEMSLSVLIAGGRVKNVPTKADSSSDMSSVGGSTTFPNDSIQELSIPSFQALLDEMLLSVDDFDIVCAKLQDPEWQPIFYNLTPDEFGGMIAHVHQDHDQPKVATVVAGQISLESQFTAEHVTSALRNAADWTRTGLVQQLLPFCNDLGESHNTIVEELTPWELMVLANDLETALGRG